MNVRAKFKVDANYVPEWMKNTPQKDTQHVITMSAVYSNEPDHENKKFSDATPSGSFQMNIKDGGPWSFFKPGFEYYLDFSESPKVDTKVSSK